MTTRLPPPVQLIVFAKAPVAGLAKTRLIPALGAEGAAALAARLLDHALGQAALAARSLQARLELCVTPDAAHPLLAQAAQRHGADLSAQGEGDLGARMHRALARGLHAAPAALLIGTDAPGLDAAALQAAAAALGGALGSAGDRASAGAGATAADAVFVPAHDGGYALVGLRRTSLAAGEGLFADMRWSTPQVMAETRRRAAAGGLRWLELPPVHDIDEPADLQHLPAGWLTGGGRADCTAG